MGALAIISHLLHYVLATLAVACCVTLFRRHRAVGWIFVSAVFAEPFLLLAMRAIRGLALLPYKTMTTDADGILQVSYRMNFPFLYLVAVAGLLLLVREARRE